MLTPMHTQTQSVQSMMSINEDDADTTGLCHGRLMRISQHVSKHTAMCSEICKSNSIQCVDLSEAEHCKNKS